MSDDDGRRELIAGLTGHGEADRGCRRALEADASFTVGTGRVPVEELVATYGRRVWHLKEQGIATVGSDTVVVRLLSFDGATLRIGSVRSSEATFVVFLDDQLNAVSCLGVASSAANCDRDWAGP